VPRDAGDALADGRDPPCETQGSPRGEAVVLADGIGSAVQPCSGSRGSIGGMWLRECLCGRDDACGDEGGQGGEAREDVSHGLVSEGMPRVAAQRL
jgi:hypothetical protein